MQIVLSKREKLSRPTLHVIIVAAHLKYIAHGFTMKSTLRKELSRLHEVIKCWAKLTSDVHTASCKHPPPSITTSVDVFGQSPCSHSQFTAWHLQLQTGRTTIKNSWRQMLIKASIRRLPTLHNLEILTYSFVIYYWERWQKHWSRRRKGVGNWAHSWTHP